MTWHELMISSQPASHSITLSSPPSRSQVASQLSEFTAEKKMRESSQRLYIWDVRKMRSGFKEMPSSVAFNQNTCKTRVDYQRLRKNAFTSRNEAKMWSFKLLECWQRSEAWRWRGCKYRLLHNSTFKQTEEAWWALIHPLLRIRQTCWGIVFGRGKGRGTAGNLKFTMA